MISMGSSNWFISVASRSMGLLKGPEAAGAGEMAILLEWPNMVIRSGEEADIFDNRVPALRVSSAPGGSRLRSTFLGGCLPVFNATFLCL